MKHMALVLLGVSAFLVGCNGDDPVKDVNHAGSPTEMEIASSPPSPWATFPVTITVTARNEQLEIQTVAVDFDNDGSIDDTQSWEEFHRHIVEAPFTHTYAAVGTYEFRAVVTDASGVETSQSIPLTVRKAVTVPVKYVVNALSPEDGRCYAFGPPITCPDCAVLIGRQYALPLTMTLGDLPPGWHVSVDQGFSQWPVVYNDQTYRCDFRMNIFAGQPGEERSIANGMCSTQSLTRPALLKCRIAVSAVVP